MANYPAPYWNKKAREEKKNCDHEIITLEEFQQWLRDSKI